MHLKIVYHGDIYFGAEDRQVEPRYFGQNEAKYGDVGAPGEVVVAARAGEEGTEMKTESQTRAFWPIGSNRCNAASLPFTGVQQTRVAR